MERILLEIVEALKETGAHEAGRLDDERLIKIIRSHNRELPNDKQFSKKKLLPYYLRTKVADPERWRRWDIDPATEELLLRTLRMRPRRTASGVATITIITKPWRCSSNCLYCPNDLRMPKSYLSDEPACQRAERNCFDPYLQVASRLQALTEMGHATDKIELIVLGGTWSDYPAAYQIWFITELFRALNDEETRGCEAEKRRALYAERGIGFDEEDLRRSVAEAQREIRDGLLTYNQAMELLYAPRDGAGEGQAASGWGAVSREQVATFAELEAQHRRNETAQRRVVGLVVETRPDLITIENLTLLRRFGCTKIQMGVQSLDPVVLKANDRRLDPDTIRRSFELVRLFGFKIHAHFMVNLFGSTPSQDIIDYRRFVTEESYRPDEVKLYPCVLIEGTGLCKRAAAGEWQPYDEETLLEILIADTRATPSFTRISRMIRDFSSHDIMAGNTKPNLRQLVERRIEEAGKSVSEIRMREIGADEVDVAALRLDVTSYATSATSEYFLQWVNEENKIAGFLRLSLPDVRRVHEYQMCADRAAGGDGALPIEAGEAMIREVHVYGKVARLREVTGAQHLGLGRELIAAACEIAKSQGYARVNVISSVGTREYYRQLGFKDVGLYQSLSLDDCCS